MFVVLIIPVLVDALKVWNLALNLNPSDGHIMDYCQKWFADPYGTSEAAFTADFVDPEAPSRPINYLAIVRHRAGVPNAVKVWQLKDKDRTLRDWFNEDKTNTFATQGSHIEYQNTTHYPRDPIFGYNGGLIFNVRFSNNGLRIVNEGVIPVVFNVTNDSSAGLGGILTDCSTGYAASLRSEVSWTRKFIPGSNGQPGYFYVMGSDHGAGFTDTNWLVYKSVGDFGSYAIYVSRTLARFSLKGNLQQNMYDGRWRYVCGFE